MKKLICIFLSLLFVAMSFFGCTKNSDDIEKTINYTYDSAYSYDGSTISAYELLCGAVLEYKEAVRFNLGMLDDVLQLYYTSFPPNDLVKSIAILDDNSGVAISYKNDENTHRELVSRFEDKINQIIDECSKNASKTLFVLNAYNYVITNMNLSDENGITAFDAILNDKGNSYTYSNMFEYILQQKGIPAYHILASDESGAGFAMSQAEINGSLYFFDATREFTENKGEKLLYFGMTDDDLKEYKIINPLYTSTQNAKEADNPYFDACRFTKSWEIDSSNKKLLVTRNDNIIVEIAL